MATTYPVIRWKGPIPTSPHPYTCGYCSVVVSASLALIGEFTSQRVTAGQEMLATSVEHVIILFCPQCSQPTYTDSLRRQIPGVVPGGPVNGTPDNIAKVYDEVRSCIAAGAFTGAILTARTLLSHIAATEGADPKQSFKQHVQYLADQGYIAMRNVEWVDHVRDLGNTATHDLVIMTRDEAERILAICEVVLKTIYEFPARIAAVNGRAST